MATAGTEGYMQPLPMANGGSKALGGPSVGPSQKQAAPLPSGISVQELKQMTALRMAQHQELQRQAQVHHHPSHHPPGGPPAGPSGPFPPPPPPVPPHAFPIHAYTKPTSSPPAPPTSQPFVAPVTPQPEAVRPIGSPARQPGPEAPVEPPLRSPPLLHLAPPPPVIRQQSGPAAVSSMGHFSGGPGAENAQGGQGAQSNVAPMPHGLTVQELKELTRMRLAREAGLVASFHAAAAAANAAATMANGSQAPQSQPKPVVAQPPPNPQSSQAAATAASLTSLPPDMADKARMYVESPALREATVGPPPPPPQSSTTTTASSPTLPSTSFLRRPSPPLSSSFPPVTSAGLIFETNAAQAARVNQLRKEPSLDAYEEEIIYAPPPMSAAAANALLQEQQAQQRLGMRLMTPLQHIRPPQPIRSGSGDLVMNPLRKSTSSSSDLEAMSVQMAEYVLLTPKSPHTSFIGTDPFAYAAAMLQQQRDMDQRVGLRLNRTSSTSSQGPADFSPRSSVARRRTPVAAVSDKGRFSTFTFDASSGAIRGMGPDGAGVGAMRNGNGTEMLSSPSVGFEGNAVDSSEDEDTAVSGPAVIPSFNDDLSPTVRALDKEQQNSKANRGLKLGSAVKGVKSNRAYA